MLQTTVRTLVKLLCALLALGTPVVCSSESKDEDLPPAIVVPINIAQMTVPTTIPIEKQVDRHAINLRRLQALSWGLKRGAENPNAAESLRSRIAESQRNTWHLLAPYAIAAAQRDALTRQGYLLVGLDDRVGRACDKVNRCRDVDATIAMMMIVSNSLSQNLRERSLRTLTEQQALTGLKKFATPSPEGQTSALYEVLNAMTSRDPSGELAAAIRDPARPPRDIVESWRKRVGSDLAPIAAAIRDPIRCTNQEVFRGC